jgi:DNA polymerase III subunit delta'
MPFTSEEAYAHLERASAHDRVAHAYLLTGPAGSGKRELAGRICSLLLGEGAGDPWTHPDVHRIEPESKSRRILIDQVRELERNLQMRSMLGGAKVGVIVDADRLQPNAANAFLKTLEEPPGRSHLLLLSSLPDQLLETILSRCLEVPLRRTEAFEPAPIQQRLLASLQAATLRDASGLVPAFALVREFQMLLAEARETIQGEAEAALKAEEQHYKQASDAGKWLDDREDYYKALVESRYVAARNALLDVLEQWHADALRQQAGDSPSLDHPLYAAETALLAARDSAPGLLRKAAAFGVLREHLGNPGIQEQLAIECAFLAAFATP